MAESISHFFGDSRFLSASGDITAATIYFYYTGTTTLAPIYTDKALTSASVNPINTAAGAILPNIFLDSSIVYRRRTVFSDGTVWDVDPVQITANASYVSATDGASGTLWSTVQGFINKIMSSAGSAIIGIIAPFTGAVSRTLSSKTYDWVSVKDFGAKGDGATDDTAAFNAAFAWSVSNYCDIYVPAGVYIVQSLILNSTAYAYMPTLFGSGRHSTVIKKKSGSGTGPVLTIGSTTATNTMAGITIRSMTIDGVSAAASNTVVTCYSLVRSTFYDTIFKNADQVLTMYGGVSTRISNCEILYGNYGVFVNSFGGLANANYPNALLIDGQTIISGHAIRGVYFDNGRMLKIIDCEFDTCGTSGNNTTSAIFIGSNIDSEDGGVNPSGVIIDRCWFEQCAGAASIVLNSGDNIISNNNFGPNPNSVYDIYVNGGSYVIDNCRWSGTIKAPAIYESGSNIRGSYITRCRQLTGSNVSINTVKTQYDFAGYAYTVASLPATPTSRTRAWVYDSVSPASGNFGALLTGGGSNVVPVFFDGVSWRIG